MKRNEDLLKKILEVVEEEENGRDPLEIKLDEYSNNEIQEHLRMLQEEGLIETMDFSSHEGDNLQPTRLTSSGHKWLDKFRSYQQKKDANRSKGVDNETVSNDLIQEGENNKVEFKETFLYDVYQDQPNKELKKEAVKEICAFANSQGGTLIIGVRDEDRKVTGLERDFKLMQMQEDSFELQLNQEISDHLGEVFASQLVDVRFEEEEGNTVCAIKVQPADEPIFFGEDDFYIRRGRSTVPLSNKETQEYIEKHF